MTLVEWAGRVSTPRYRQCMRSRVQRGRTRPPYSRICSRPPNLPGARGLGELGQAPLQESPLRFLPDEAEGPLIGGAGFLDLPQPPAKIRARRMRQVVVGQIAAREDRVDQFEAGSGTVPHGDRHGAIQFNDG